MRRGTPGSRARHIALAALAGAAWACAPVALAAPDSAANNGQEPPAPVPDSEAATLPPAGFGSLRQDEFSMTLVDGALNVKVTPLSESVIRLAAPDTYERLHALAVSRAAEARRTADRGAPALFLVSFFSREPNTEYRPEELQLTHRGRTLRPAGILALTSGWGRQLLQPQSAQSAIYVYDAAFDYALPITVRYGLRDSEDWYRRVIPRLEEERTRVETRAGGWRRGGS